MDADDGEVHHDGGHRNPPPQAKSDGEPPKMCVKGTDVPQSLMGSVSTPRAIWMSESIIYRDGGGAEVRAPATQDDGREQGTARRPDTSGDVPGAEDGGGHGHPKGGGMAKWMEDEQNLSTRRGVAWCKRAPAMVVPEGALRSKWMRMMAKCIMTQPKGGAAWQT